MDVAVGEPTTRILEPNAGATAHFPNLSVNLVGREEHHESSAMMSFGDSIPNGWMGTTTSASKTKRSGSALIFAQWPYLARNAPVEFEYTFDKGYRYRGGGGIGGSGFFHLRKFGSEDLSHIREVRENRPRSGKQGRGNPRPLTPAAAPSRHDPRSELRDNR